MSLCNCLFGHIILYFGGNDDKYDGNNDNNHNHNDDNYYLNGKLRIKNLLKYVIPHC